MQPDGVDSPCSCVFPSPHLHRDYLCNADGYFVLQFKPACSHDRAYSFVPFQLLPLFSTSSPGKRPLMARSALTSGMWFLPLITLWSSIRTVFAQFKTRPDLVPAPWNVTFTNTSAGSLTSEGFIFMAPRVQEPTGLMIFDNDGQLVWLNNDTSVQGAFDFRPQTWNSQQYLTYWSGTASTAGFGQGFVFMLDSTYKVTHNLTAPNMSDFHEVCDYFFVD